MTSNLISDSKDMNAKERRKTVLTSDQIKTFQRDGILVLDNVLTSSELKDAQRGLHDTLLEDHGIDHHNLRETGHNLQKLSSTNGSGGVIDLFYPKFKIDVATNERLFRATVELWQSAFCHNGESEEESIQNNTHYMYHPFGSFNCEYGYICVDRLGFRLPSKLSEEIGKEIHELKSSSTVVQMQQSSSTSSSWTSKKKKKLASKLAIQRSLTPHLDCCPESIHSLTTNDGNDMKKAMWRPIQCFVSLTDNLDANTGGFEAAPGFHRNFHEWTKSRPKSSQPNKYNPAEMMPAAPCIGEYTHIRPHEDKEVMEQVRHIPVRAGSAVLWDNRIPHANAYRNDSSVPRAVIYCSFLPDVPINRVYVKNQLEDWKLGRVPRSMWINVDDETTEMGKSCDDKYYEFTELGRKLIGLDNWDE